ncbi:MAG: hypothetical protein HZC54_00235 [Verrucomicrobia bacterium]|nr:hypothetical protein [Verrucomicrobiota bacterium]
MRDMETAAEIGAFARIVEGVTLDYAEAEENLLFTPLNSMLAEKGQFAQFSANHKECIGLLKKAQQARNVADAKSHLLAAMRILRDHFGNEERTVIALAQETFQPKSLQKLGEAWMERHADAQAPAAA